MPDLFLTDMTLVVIDAEGAEVGRVALDDWFSFADALARGYDREDAAQVGEADPWSPEFPRDPRWENWRHACAFAGLQAAVESVMRPVGVDGRRSIAATITGEACR